MKVTKASAEHRSNRSRLRLHTHAQPAAARHVGRNLWFLFIFSFVLGIGCWAFALTNPLALSLAFTFAALEVYFQLIAKPSRLPKSLGEPLPRSLRGELFRGGLTGAAAVVLVAALLPLAGRLPINQKWFDRDRTELELRVDQEVTAGHLNEAAQLIEDRLGSSVSAAWRKELQAEQIRILQMVLKREPTPEQQNVMRERIRELETKYGLLSEPTNPEPPVAVEATNAPTSPKKQTPDINADTTSQNTRPLLEWVGALRSAKDFAAADALLKAQLISEPQSGVLRKLAQSRLENLLQWGDLLDQPRDRYQNYYDAYQLAKRYGLDASVALAKARRADQEQRQLPTVLPSGTRARLLELSNSASDDNQLTANVTIESAPFQFVSGLLTKDFRIQSGKAWLRDFSVEEATMDIPKAASVVVLIDESPLAVIFRNEIASSIYRLVDASPSRSQFSVMTFCDTTRRVTAWTHDASIIHAGLSSRLLGKKTATRAAIAKAVSVLAEVPGPRLLVLFSSGNDNSRTGPSPSELESLCRANDVRVLAVGLETKDLGELSLRRLAMATAGDYSRGISESLQERFLSLHTTAPRPVYRLRLNVESPAINDLAVHIGRGDSALTIPLSSVRETVTTNMR